MLESGEIEAGEILSLLDQRIQGKFKDFDPTASLTNKSPNDGQYGSFIPLITSNDSSASLLNGYPTQHTSVKRALSSQVATPHIPLAAKALDTIADGTQNIQSRASRPNPHHSNPRLLSKYIPPPPIDIIRVTQEDLQARLVVAHNPLIPDVDMLYDGKPEPTIVLPFSSQPLSIQNIVLEMTQPLVPLLSPFPLEIFVKDGEPISLSEFSATVQPIESCAKVTAVILHNADKPAEGVPVKRKTDEEDFDANKKLKKEHSSSLFETLNTDNRTLETIVETSLAPVGGSVPGEDDIKKDVSQNRVVVSEGGKLTLKIPRKSQPAKESLSELVRAKSPVASETRVVHEVGETPVSKSSHKTIKGYDVEEGGAKEKRRDKEIEKKADLEKKDYMKVEKGADKKTDKKYDKKREFDKKIDREHGKKVEKDVDRGLDKKTSETDKKSSGKDDRNKEMDSRSKQDVSHKVSRDRSKDHDRPGLSFDRASRDKDDYEKQDSVDKDRDKVNRLKSKERDSYDRKGDDKAEAKEKLSGQKDGRNDKERPSDTKDKERTRRPATWLKLKNEATNLKRIADELNKQEMTRADSLVMYLSATVAFMECCSARELEEPKGAVDLYRQCASFFSTCAAICEKYKDNLRASIQLKSSALVSARAFQLKRERLLQQCEQMIQQLRHAHSPSSTSSSSSTPTLTNTVSSSNIPTPPTMPSPTSYTPPSPAASTTADKNALDPNKLLPMLEDVREACSVYDTWNRSEVLAQLEPLPNYLTVDIQQAVEYIKRQVQASHPKK